MGIIIKSEKEIAVMRQAGKIVADILKILTGEVKPGMKTKEFDTIATRELKRMGAASSFKGYHGYPATVCVSVNDEIVHGIPGERVLEEGDIVSLDFGAIYQGFQGDAAVTVPVGRVSLQAANLITTTKGSLEAGITAAKNGAKLGDISAAVQAFAESQGFNVIREYTGHGIGREMHEEPQIPNFGVPGTGPTLKTGMTFALEPMLCIGDWHTRIAQDHWTVLTAFGGIAAHFENTIAINDNGAEVLTRGAYA